MAAMRATAPCALMYAYLTSGEGAVVMTNSNAGMAPAGEVINGIIAGISVGQTWSERTRFRFDFMSKLVRNVPLLSTFKMSPVRMTQ
jgi:hypothetical protein